MIKGVWSRTTKLLLFWKKERYQPPHSVIQDLDLKLLNRLNRWKIPAIGQLRYIPKLLSGDEKKRLAISVAVFLIAIALLGGRVWLRNTIAAPAVGGMYTEGLIGSPRFINPLLAQGSDADRDLAALVFAGLLKKNDAGTLEPDLAEFVTISEDQKVYTAQLRENLKWHDGEPLTIADVLFTIESIQDPAFKSPLRVTFAGVTVDQLDDRTVTFTLRQPAPAFLSALTVGIVPEHVWYSIPPAQAHLAEINLKPIGSGPYRFKSLLKDSNGTIRTIVLARYEQYHGSQPFIKELSFKFYTDMPTALEALKNKNVEGLGFVPLDYAEDLTAIKTVSLIELNVSQYNALFFNPERNEALRDKNVRKALARALDRDRIVREALGNNAETVSGPLIPGFTDVTEAVPYDTAEAAKLLETGGWKPTASSTMRFKGDTVLAVELTAVDQPEQEKVAALIKEQWEAIGVATTVQVIPKGKVKRDIIEPRAYQILLFGQIINSPQDIYAFWHSSQNRHPGANLSLLANKDIDALVEQIRNTSDTAKLPELYTKFMQKISDEQFALFLYSPNYLYPISKKIHGMESTFRISAPSDRFTTINSWYIDVKRRLK